MNTKKIILISLIILTMINIVFLPSSYATKIDDIFNAGDDFLKSGDEPETVLDTDKLEETSTVIYKMLLTIAICVSVLVGAVLGIQFILGSVEGKVKVQEAMVPYIVGCFVVFGAFTIWGIAINTGNSIASNGKTLEQAAIDIGNRNKEIEDGKIDLMNISESDLKQRYSENRIYDTLKQNIVGDSRGGGGQTLEQATAALGKTNKKIWQACKDRGLLKTDGYTLK